MALLLPAFGLFLLAIGASSGFFVALLRSLPPKRIGVDLLGIAVGGAIGVLPGGAMAFLAVLNGVTGPGASVPPWSLVMITVAAGAAVGVCVGLGLADRLLGLRGTPVALAAAVGGLATGSLLAGAGLVLAQQTPLESACLVLIPLTLLGTTLAGVCSESVDLTVEGRVDPADRPPSIHPTAPANRPPSPAPRQARPRSPSRRGRCR